MTDRQRLRKIELAGRVDLPDPDDWQWLIERAKCCWEADKAIKKVASLVWRWMQIPQRSRIDEWDLYKIIKDYRAKLRALKAKDEA